MQPQVFHPDPDKKRDDAPPLNASTPVSQMRPNNLGSPRKPWGRIVVTLLVLVGLGVGGWYGYRWYQNNNNEKADLKSQVADLQKQNESLKSSAQPSPVPAKKDTYQIKELGIQFTANMDLDGLVYAFDQNSKIAAFTTRSISYATAVDNKGDKYSLGGSIGLVQLLDKAPSGNAGSPPEKIATLSNGKLVYYTSPQNIGSNNKTTQDLIVKTQTAFKKALATAELIK